MSRLLSSRSVITGALDRGGINVATTGKWSGPCVLVEAGDPWATTEAGMGRRRLGRWLLTLVAGRADTEGILESLAELVDQVDRALLTIPGVSLPSWAQPFSGTLGGVAYACTSATIQTVTEEDPTP
jgi:hypothetical protein